MYINSNTLSSNNVVSILHFHCLYVEYHQFLVVGVAVAVHLLAFWLLLKEKIGL